MSNGGGPLPVKKLYCPKCKQITYRVYKFEEGYGKCKECNVELLKFPSTNRHIAHK